jgi:hypothetical protein
MSMSSELSMNRRRCIAFLLPLGSGEINVSALDIRADQLYAQLVSPPMRTLANALIVL